MSPYIGKIIGKVLKELCLILSEYLVVCRGRYSRNPSNIIPAIFLSLFMDSIATKRSLFQAW
jgi:hypothetical protein